MRPRKKSLLRAHGSSPGLSHFRVEMLFVGGFRRVRFTTGGTTDGKAG
jgi:hypothetical protein